MPRLEVLPSQLLDDHGPRGGAVPEELDSRVPGHRLHEFRREARLGERRLGQGGDQARDLPVAGGRVLPGGCLPEAPVGHGRPGDRRDTEDVAVQVPETGGPEVGQIEAPHRGGGVSEGVGALVPVVGGVGGGARSAGVDHDDDCAVE